MKENQICRNEYYEEEIDLVEIFHKIEIHKTLLILITLVVTLLVTGFGYYKSIQQTELQIKLMNGDRINKTTINREMFPNDIYVKSLTSKTEKDNKNGKDVLVYTVIVDGNKDLSDSLIKLRKSYEEKLIKKNRVLIFDKYTNWKELSEFFESNKEKIKNPETNLEFKKNERKIIKLEKEIRDLQDTITFYREVFAGPAIKIEKMYDIFYMDYDKSIKKIEGKKAEIEKLEEENIVIINKALSNINIANEKDIKENFIDMKKNNDLIEIKYDNFKPMKKFLGVGVVAGFMLGLFAVFLKEFTDSYKKRYKK